MIEVEQHEQPTPTKRPFYIRSPEHGTLRQGEIISDLFAVRLKTGAERDTEDNAKKVPYAYSIIVTQDCDLEQDYAARKNEGAGKHRLLRNILLCEVEQAKILKHGDMIQELPEDKRARSPIGRREWKIVVRNKDERYHFLAKIEKLEDSLNEGLPQLVVEFKRYFTIATDEIYYQINAKTAKRRSILKSPYLEHFNTRFHFYHSRVALPEEYPVEPIQPPNQEPQ